MGTERHYRYVQQPIHQTACNTLSTIGDRYKSERISSEDQVKLYLTRLVTTMPHNHSFYVEVRALFLKGGKHFDRDELIDCTITSITQDLQNLKALELNNSSSYNESHHHPRYQRNHSQLRSRDRTNRNFKPTMAANMITQSKKYKPLKCWNCGHGHHLRDCPTVTTEKREQLFQSYRRSNENTRQHPSSSTPHHNRDKHQSNTANVNLLKTKTNQVRNIPNTSENAKTNTSNTVVTNMSRRLGTTFASVANHLASMAKTIGISRQDALQAFKAPDTTCSMSSVHRWYQVL
jgi:hypothetical protein